MKRTVAIDLETLSVAHNPALLSIGAVCIETGHTFYINIDPTDCQRRGLDVDAGTVLWWLGQDKAAQDALVNSTVCSLGQALDKFNDWLKNIGWDHADKECTIWSYGAKSDLVWMNSAYAAAGAQPYWSYRQEMCGRTFRAMTGANADKTGVHHNALDDAQWLAEVLVNGHFTYRNPGATS